MKVEMRNSHKGRYVLKAVRMSDLMKEVLPAAARSKNRSGGLYENIVLIAVPDLKDSTRQGSELDAVKC